MTAPLSALTDTWNAIGTAFTAIKMTVTNTASAAGSKLLDLIVGSTSMFAVGKNGHVSLGGLYAVDDGGPILLDASESVTAVEPSGANVYGIYQELDFSGATTGITSGTSIHGFNEFISISGAAYALNTVRAYNAVTVLNTTGAVNYIYGGAFTSNIDGPSSVNFAYSCSAFGFYTNTTIGRTAQFYSETEYGAALTVTDAYGLYLIEIADDPGTLNITNNYGVWIGDKAGFGTLLYPFWYDGRGVWRVKDEGTTKGSVVAWYNPTFTKYTPGAVNFERGVLQWNAGDVLEIGAEAGGTGTLRKIRHLGAGHIFPLANLPTSDPGVAGQLFTSGAPSAGVPKALMISGG